MDLRGALTTPQVNHRVTIVDPIAIGGLLRAIDGFDGQPTTEAALRLDSTRLARDYGRRTLAIPISTHIREANFRKHVECRLAASRLCD
jgi:hypothetical protein